MSEYLTLAPVASFFFAITIACSLLAFSNENLYGRMMLHPYSVSRGQNVITLLTSGFIHKDWMHLFFNMLSYYFFAFQLEVYIGHWQFGVLYLASLIISDLPTVAKHKDHYNYHSLGASGAVSAVIFSFIMYSPLSQMMILPIPFPIPAIIFGVLYLVYCHFASKHSRDNINHDAHMYGALCGLFITAILHPDVLQSFIQQVKGGVI
ncbi:rhomboid family intramembrane serine protease [Mucilaginibacter auburnensis]|uniref:Membrane associated rhomboid family serine protease n=1 Tax=Mucilaginibacter auburnensis TaxID=1457233 RepID=A0A2H9VR40_9SPHI|nr:rhomboid family intramembrane serine protease [Mucilaginibacter auburnensis]PJJ83285.1 membrane associated rhomboid family serine protease [Mucilaginibacter auburnensis]